MSKRGSAHMIFIRPTRKEFNREAVSIIARYNFAPTELSKRNLVNEGKRPETVFVTGNTAIDALRDTVRADYRHPELELGLGAAGLL